ncbi:MAG: ABC transporter ATP-binding protein/permease [Bacteroidales bacterium]|nr:ABC transporter ATP-binding protein/permease [Bacteroidales bacterium]
MPPGFNMRGPAGADRGPRAGAHLKDLKKDSTVWRLFKYVFRHYKVNIGIVLVCIVVSSLASLASSLFTRTLIDDYITPLTGALNPDYGPLAVALLKLAGVLLAGIVAGYAQSLIMIYVGQGTLLSLRKDLFSHMEKLPLRYFDSHSHGDIMSVYTNDVDTLRQVVGSSVPNLFKSLVTILATFVSMLVLSLPLTLVSVLMAWLMYRVTTSLGKLSKKYFVERQQNLGKVNGFIEEMVSGQKVVKVYCHEEVAVKEFEKLNEQLRSSVYNANKIGNIIMPINSNIGNFAYVLLALVGAVIALGYTPTAGISPLAGFAGAVAPWFLRGLDGAALTLGTLVSFLTLQRNFTRPVSSISNEINSIVMAAAGTDRLYALLDEEPEVDNGKQELKDIQGEISLKDVDFGYVPEKQVLYDITLTAYPGQKIAFVGGTGAGKTTITNLINRFYETQDGSITFDGLNIKDIRKDSLRHSLGMVLQETHLFGGTVMENIRYGRLDATDEECREAAQLACANDFIRRMPKGYDTVLSADGGNLSQGERQLLAIARAAVANPPVLILDEATSSIDTRTERLIQKGMDSLMKGRTTFVIAHRLSTVQNADYIMVLDHGRIIERGKHQELLDQKGKYYQLYTGNQIV